MPCVTMLRRGISGVSARPVSAVKASIASRSMKGHLVVLREAALHLRVAIALEARAGEARTAGSGAMGAPRLGATKMWTTFAPVAALSGKLPLP